MAKMTYAEQLRHPNWQRKRLERLSAAGWACQECGSTEKTLHVHHKKYFRNRLAWEYPDHELQVLCEDCHGDFHRIMEAIDSEIAGLDAFELPLVHALLVGYRGGFVESEGFPKQVADSFIFDGEHVSRAYWLGQIASDFADLKAEDAKNLRDLFFDLNPSGFAALIQQELDKLAKKS